MQILVIKLSSMGDIIHVLPALSDAVAAIPNISFDWVVEENFAEIPSWHSASNLIIPIAMRRWRKQLLTALKKHEIQNFWQKLRAKKYDYVIDVQGLLKSAVITRAAKGVSCGFSANNAREPLAAYFYKCKFDIAKNLHAIERARQLFAKALGYKISESFPDFALKKSVFNCNSIAEKYLMFVHGTSRDEKCWPEKNWIALAKIATEHGFKVKLPWGKEAEFDRAQRIAAECKNVEVLPKSSLTTLGTLLLNSKGVFAVDTGLGHLAAALNVPAVSLYGPTNPDLIGTRGKNQIHITNMETCSAEKAWEQLNLLSTLAA